MIIKLPKGLSGFGETCDDTGCYQEDPGGTTISFPQYDPNSVGGTNPVITPVITDGSGYTGSALGPAVDCAMYGGQWDGTSCKPVGIDQTAVCAAQNGIWANNTCTSKDPTAGGLVVQPNDSISCAAAGGSWNGTKCANAWSGNTPAVKTDILTSLLNALTGKGVTTTPTTSAACAASGGTWNGVTCTKSNTNSMMLYALMGIGAIALLSKKR